MSSPPVPLMATPVTDLIQHPWSSYAEFQHVYRLIYEKDDDVCSLKEAKNCLIAWSVVSRKTAFKPEIAALTACVNAALHDKQQADDLCLQSLYSTALIRFCEVMRQYEFNTEKNRIIRISFIKTGDNRSDLAESLGLPGWIADIRHQCAHGEPVSLDVMRRATFLAMDWLAVNFWTVRLQKRMDRQVDSIMEHVLSDATAVEKRAKNDFSELVRHNPHAAVKFAVRSLLTATAASDLTFHKVDPKITVLIEVIVNCGQVHRLLHNLIDHFDDDESDIRSAATLWFAEVLKGLTTQTSALSPPLSKFAASVVQVKRLPEVEVHFMKVLNHLLLCPSQVALAYVPCFKKIIPSKSDMIDRLREAMATLLGVGLSREAVGADYRIKTIDDVKHGMLTTTPESKKNPYKRIRRH